MTISLTLLEYLEWNRVDYDIVEHGRSSSSLETAESAHVPPGQVAKCVLLEDETDYLMAVLPANRRIELSKLQHQLNRELDLATEDEAADLFFDCDIGAIPALGQAFGYEVIVDDSLNNCQDVYFEAGDHRDLVHMRGKDFLSLMDNAQHGHFSQPR